MYNKRSATKPSVKKSGSVESASDRSMSPNDVSAVKENKPTLIKNNRQQVIPKRTIASKSESAKTGITKQKPATKTSTKSAVAAKTTPVKQTKASSTNANSKLLSPRVRPGSGTTKSAQKASSNLNSLRSPRSPAAPKAVNPSWKVPSVSPTVGRPSSVKPLPGRGGPKKQRKVYNPPTLFSLCKTAVSSIIVPPEVDEEAKEFLKRRLFSQALFGTVWDVLTKETKTNRITKEALITERDELSSELKELKENVDNKISTLTKQHSDTVANITATLVSTHQSETKQLREGYESTIADLRSQLSVIEDKHTNQVHNIRDRHTQEIATLHKEHEDQRNQLIISQQQEIARMEGTQRALEEQNEYLDSQIKEKEEIMQEEIQSQVQEQVQRYSTINAELQSLRDVIDMRNAEIKKLNTKIKDLEIKAEDIPALEKDLRSYKDHNEQLRATIEMKAESERTLNLTQESLYMSIKEKEADNKNMVLKCEELQFRLSLLEEKQGGNNGTNIFAPTNYSTPACSPRRQMSEPPPPSDYVSSPRPSNRPKSQVNLFDAMEAANQILPLHD